MAADANARSDLWISTFQKECAWLQSSDPELFRMFFTLVLFNSHKLFSLLLPWPANSAGHHQIKRGHIFMSLLRTVGTGMRPIALQSAPTLLAAGSSHWRGQDSAAASGMLSLDTPWIWIELCSMCRLMSLLCFWPSHGSFVVSGTSVKGVAGCWALFSKPAAVNDSGYLFLQVFQTLLLYFNHVNLNFLFFQMKTLWGHTGHSLTQDSSATWAAWLWTTSKYVHQVYMHVRVHAFALRKSMCQLLSSCIL